MTAPIVGRDDDIVLFGAGGHARSVVDVLDRIGARVAAVVAPTSSDLATPAIRIASDEEGASWAVARGVGAVLAIGDGRRRLELASFLAERGVTLPILVAATATVARDVVLGSATIVLEHAHVGPGSTLGRACIVNTRASIDHDGTLGEAVHCAPGVVLAGDVKCADGVLFGVGAIAVPGVRVGAWATVGAGSVVVADVPSGVTVIGAPARCRVEDDR